MPSVFSGAGGVLLRQKNSSGGMVHAATQRRARTRATILRIMKILSCMLALLFISNVSVAQDASSPVAFEADVPPSGEWASIVPSVRFCRWNVARLGITAGGSQ
jgi:hypothetical protein